jgi:hypothetical protein
MCGNQIFDPVHGFDFIRVRCAINLQRIEEWLAMHADLSLKEPAWLTVTAQQIADAASAPATKLAGRIR